MKPDIQHGKEFEREWAEAFAPLYKSYRCRFERVLDSASAGNLVRKADSDFKLQVESGLYGRPYSFYVECKASNAGKPFANYYRSLVKSSQNSSLQMAARCGAIAVVAYKDVLTGEIQIWSGKIINVCYPVKRVALNGSPAYHTNLRNLSGFAESWVISPHLMAMGIQKSGEHLPSGEVE